MVVERGGLSYPIQVEDRFSGVIQDFRTQLKGLINQVREYRAVLKDRSDAALPEEKLEASLIRLERALRRANKLAREQAAANKEAAKAQLEQQAAADKATQAQTARAQATRAATRATEEDAQRSGVQARALNAVTQAAERAAASLGAIKRSSAPGIAGQFQDLSAAVARVSGQFTAAKASGQELQAEILSLASAEEVLVQAQSRIIGALLQRTILEETARQKIAEGIALNREEAEAIGGSALAAFELTEAKSRLDQVRQRGLSKADQEIEKIKAETRALERQQQEARRLADERARLLETTRLPVTEQTDINLRAEAALRNQLNQQELENAKRRVAELIPEFQALGDAAKRSGEGLTLQARALQAISDAAKKAAASIQFIAGTGTGGLSEQFRELAASASSVAGAFSFTVESSQALRNAILSQASAEELLNEAQGRILSSLRQRAALEVQARLKQEQGIPLTRQEAEALGKAALAAFDLAAAKKSLADATAAAVDPLAQEIARLNEEAAAMRRVAAETRRAAVERERLRAASGLPISQQTDINLKAEEQLRNELAALQLRQAREELIRTDARFAALAKTSETLENRINRVSFTFRRLFGILAAFTIARRVVQTFNELIAGSVRFNAQLEQAELGIGTIIAATAEIRDPFGRTTEGAEKLNLALQEGQRQVQLLRIDALQTSATFEELVKAFQVAIGPGIQAGLGLDQIREFTLRISQAAQAIGLAQNQLAEEVRSLLEGTIQSRTTRIATVLGITNEDIKLAKEAGNLFELLQIRFQAFEEASERAGNTFTASLARARDAIFQLGGAANQPFFDQLRGLLGDIRSGALVREGQGLPLQASPEAVASIRALGDGLAEAVKQARRFLGAFDNRELTGIFRGLGAAIAGVAIAFETVAEGIVKGFANVASLVDNIIRGFTLFLGITEETESGLQNVVSKIVEVVTTIFGVIVVSRLWAKTTAGIVALYGFFAKNTLFLGFIGALKTVGSLLVLMVKGLVSARAATLFFATAGAAAATALGAVKAALLPLLPALLVLGGAALLSNLTKTILGFDLLAAALEGVGKVLGGLFDVLTFGLFRSSLEDSVSITDDLSEAVADVSKGLSSADERAQELNESLQEVQESIREAVREFQTQQAIFGLEGAASRQVSTATETQLELAEKLQKAQEEITKLAEGETKERERQVEITRKLVESNTNILPAQLQDTINQYDELAKGLQRIADLQERKETLEAIKARSAAQDLELESVKQFIEAENKILPQVDGIIPRLIRGDDREQIGAIIKELQETDAAIQKILKSRNIERGFAKDREGLEKNIKDTQEEINKLIQFRVAALGLPEIAQRQKELQTLQLEIEAQERLNTVRASGDEAALIRAEADVQIAQIRRKAEEEAKALRLQAQQLDLIRQQATDQRAVVTLQRQADLARALAIAVLGKATQEANEEDLEAKKKILELNEKLLDAQLTALEREEIRIARGARRLDQLRQETREVESQRISLEAAAAARAQEASLALRGISGQAFVDREDLAAQQRAKELEIQNLKSSQEIELAILRIREKFATLSGRTAEAEALRAEILETERLTREQILALEGQLNQLGLSYNQQLELRANQQTFQLRNSATLLQAQLVGQNQYLKALVTGNDYLVQRAKLEADITQETLQRQQAFSQVQARVQELLILRNLATTAKAREAIEREINETLREGNLERQLSIRKTQELRIELERLKQRAEDPIRFGVLEAINELSGDGLRNFNLFFDATRDIISGFAQTSAQQFAAIFDPDENTDAVAAFAKFFQTVGTQFLAKAFEGLLADLLQALGLDLAKEQAKNAAFQASVATAGTTFATEVTLAGANFEIAAISGAAAISAAAAALLAAALALQIATASQAVTSGVSNFARAVFGGTGRFFHEGGPVRGYARGGSVFPFPRPAHIHPKDTVPAWLEPKEYVMPRKSVMEYGLTIFDMLRKRLIDPELVRALTGSRNGTSQVSASRVLGFQSGGPVPSISGSRSRADERPLVVPAIPATEATLAALIGGGENYLLRWLDSNGIRPADARER